MLSKNLTLVKGRMQATAAMAAWWLAAAIAALAAVCWLSAAFFLWLLESHAPVAASAIMGATWAILAGGFVLAGWLIRRSKRRKLAMMERTERSRPAQGWMNPSTISAGLDDAQLVGGRRASALLAGAFAVVWLVGRFAQSSTAPAASDDDTA